jgi:hypothetical protein
MQKNILVVAALIGAIFAAPPAFAQDANGQEPGPLSNNYTMQLRGYYWMTGFDATIRADEGSLKGTSVNVVDDLGLDKNKGVPAGELSLRFLNRNRLYVDTVNFAYTGDQRVASQFVFNGATYPAGSNVKTDMALNFMRFGYEFEVFKGPEGSIGLGLSGEYIKAKTTLITNDILSNTADASIVLPMLSLSARYAVGEWVAISLFGTGVGYDKSSAFDFQFFVDITPLEYVTLFGGYRTKKIVVETDDTKVDVGWNGLTVGVTAMF